MKTAKILLVALLVGLTLTLGGCASVKNENCASQRSRERCHAPQKVIHPEAAPAPAQEGESDDMERLD